MENFLYIVIFSVLLTFVFGKIYIKIWKASHKTENTPTGFGVCLPFLMMLYFFFISEIWTEINLSIFIIFCAGLIFLLDDIHGLPPIFRILISFLFGVLLVLEASFFDLSSEFLLVSFCVFFGLISVGLTNVINFYDGVDLNLATIVFLASLILMSFSELDTTVFHIGVIMLGFSLGFGLINKIPDTLFMGDSGSFVIALLFLYFMINYFVGNLIIPIEILSVLPLPIFDVFYVILIRLYYRHDILSRNYLHLYQRIRIRFGSFYHLLPQLVNVIIILLLNHIISPYFGNDFLVLVAICVIVTPLFYIVCRMYFVEKNYFFGDGKSNV